ncbi:MAG TPA: cupredoxin domain-containing protein [Gemmataceae bacterium]|nr:cupredoxin domain-containing protein [Gemmataceae bacterium]
MRLCHLFALSLGAVGLLAVAAPSAQACWWGHGGGWGMGWGGGGPRYAAPGYGPGPTYYAPPPAGYPAPPPVYSGPRPYYPPPPPAMPPGTTTPGALRMMPGTGTPTVAPSQATVNAKDDMFDPPTLNIQPGTTVRWNNTGKHPHTVTDRDRRFDSGDIAPGGAYTMTFHSPGTYRYYCKHHKGMEGTIVVGEPGKGPGDAGKVPGGAGTSKGPAY